MGVIHLTDLRESPGNQPRFELSDLSILVCLIVETPLRAYRLASLIVPCLPTRRFPFSLTPKTPTAWLVPKPFGKQTVLPRLQCVGATELR